MSKNQTKATTAKKEAWVAPEAKEMDVAKVTKGLPGVGGDGGGFADCTLS